MARKTALKATEQTRSASRIDKQQQSCELRFDAQTKELLIDGVPLLRPQDSQQINQLAREVYAVLQIANAPTHISVHAAFIAIARICQTASEEHGMDEEHPQYVN